MDISSAKTSDGFFLMLLVARLLLQIGTIRQFYKDNFDNKNSNLQFIFYTYVKPEVSLSSKSQENHGYSKLSLDNAITVMNIIEKAKDSHYQKK